MNNSSWKCNKNTKLNIPGFKHLKVKAEQTHYKAATIFIFQLSVTD